MKPFISIAMPHTDILQGKLTMDIFAADLWQVYKGEAQEEYKDPNVFFRKTFLTAGLKNLLDIAEKRLKGQGGDPVIQLQIPFGGGKTHALIALYHKAKEWNSKVVVIDGTVFDPKEKTLWEEIELQLTGNIDSLKGKISPGREKLHTLFLKNQPILILIDELLEYITKASAIKIGDSNLASQTLAFIQELTTTVKTLDKSLFIVTLPTSELEHFDENSERIFQQLQKIIGRLEKVYTPVGDEEVSSVIIKRLFQYINEQEARDNIEEFLNYAEKEKLLPENMDKSYYREKFIKSFPFQPEVIDVLYKRWASIPNFQRTRGLLRILALVVYSLKNSKNPFIRLGDIDLKNEEIRRELIKHIGNEFDSILAADITSPDSRSKKVDNNLGSMYSPYSFGTKCATTIFMYSFSGGPEKGVTLQEIKLSCAEISQPSIIIGEVVQKLKENLYYLSDTDLIFTNQPNLNRILLQKTESIDERDMESEEDKILKSSFSKNNKKFDVLIWPQRSKDIPDTKNLKLVVLKDYSEEKAKEFLENCGDRPRVYRNTLIFLCPSNEERISFNKFIKDKLAWQLIENDKSLNLNDEQKKEVKNKLKKLEGDTKSKIRTLYRYIFLFSKEKEGFEKIDLGISTYGKDYLLDEEVYNRLKNDNKILEKLTALLIKNKYLKNDYVSTTSILESFYTTPGEIKIINEEVFKDAIKEGVKKGLFGLGKLENNKVICDSFKEECVPELVEREVLVKEEFCTAKEELDSIESVEKPSSTPTYTPTSMPEVTVSEKDEVYPAKERYSRIYLKFPILIRQLSNVREIINYIKSKFENLEITIEISAKEGEIKKDEFEDKIIEALRQTGIELNKVENELK